MHLFLCVGVPYDVDSVVMTPMSCVVAQEARQMDLSFWHLHIIFWALLMLVPQDVPCHPIVKSAFSPRGLGVCFVLFCFFFCCATCGNFVPQPGVEPVLLTLERGVLTTGPPRKSWVSGLIGEWSEIENLGTRCIVTACVLATRPGLCPFPGFFTSETILPNFSLPVFFSAPP